MTISKIKLEIIPEPNRSEAPYTVELDSHQANLIPNVGDFVGSPDDDMPVMSRKFLFHDDVLTVCLLGY